MVCEQIIFLQEHHVENALRVFQAEGFPGLLSCLVLWHSLGEYEVDDESTNGTAVDIWHFKNRLLIGINTLIGYANLQFVLEKAVAEHQQLEKPQSLQYDERTDAQSSEPERQRVQRARDNLAAERSRSLGHSRDIK